jgi:cation diffusion facilitator family transporter
MSVRSSTAGVYVALVGNVLVVATKTLAASVTGSSAMFAEAVHSLVDTSDELLLLYGLKRSHASPDEQHPLGYGRELYFWSFIVAVLIFAIGCGASIWEGARELQHPKPIEHPGVSYVVLLASLLFEGASWIFSRHQIRQKSGAETVWAAIRRSKDPAQFTVLLEDAAAIGGIAIVFGCTLASEHFGEPRFDGIGSIGIGLLLGLVAAELAGKCKALLIGERADRQLRDDVLTIARQCDGVLAANGVITVQLAPDQIVAALSVEFADGLNSRAIEIAVAGMEEQLRRNQPAVRFLFVKPQSRARFNLANHVGSRSAREVNLDPVFETVH